MSAAIVFVVFTLLNEITAKCMDSSTNLSLLWSISESYPHWVNMTSYSHIYMAYIYICVYIWERR